MDNIKTWTGLSVEDSIRMTEDRDKWRKYVHGVATLGSRMAKEQNRLHPMYNSSETVNGRELKTDKYALALGWSGRQAIRRWCT